MNHALRYRRRGLPFLFGGVIALLVVTWLTSLRSVQTAKNRNFQLPPDSALIDAASEQGDTGIHDHVIQLKDYSRGRLQVSAIHEWRHFLGRSILSVWQQRLCESLSNDEWVLSTNNDGRHFGRKEVSRFAMKERRDFANAALQRGGGVVAYVKWELPRNHVLHREMRAFVDSSWFRSAVAQMVFANRSPLYGMPDDAIAAARRQFVQNATLGDFFVSLYSAGDFLTSHTDDSLGSIAVVGHLATYTDGGQAGRKVLDNSGSLQFFCADTQSYCITIPTTTDGILAFKTRPLLVSHQVVQNNDPLLFRFGFTGWFALPGEQQLLKY